jgi:hypothetical protein
MIQQLNRRCQVFLEFFLLILKKTLQSSSLFNFHCDFDFLQESKAKLLSGSSFQMLTIFVVIIYETI